MKTVLISGSSSGIGKEIANLLLKTGHCVIGLARNHQKFIPESINYHAYPIDFAKINLLENQFSEIHKNHPEINVIICSAGFGEFCELEQFSVTKMQKILNVNFLSQAILVKSFLPFLKKTAQGKIIFLGSECALEGHKKGSMYCASKFALRGFAQSLRAECSSSNIGVTLINPGMVDTAFFDKLNFRPGASIENSIQAEQIAEIVYQLISYKNNFVCEEINLQPMKKVVQKSSHLLEYFEPIIVQSYE